MRGARWPVMPPGHMSATVPHCYGHRFFKPTLTRGLITSMRAVVQRVSKASVTVQGETVGSIGEGLVVLLGIHVEDSEQEARWMADKIVHLRIFEDENGKMNRSLVDINKEMLIVSQFTLYGDCRKGRRPGYSSAASPEKAETLYQKFIELVEDYQISTASGHFQAMMEVNISNHGPVTLLLDSAKTF